MNDALPFKGHLVGKNVGIKIANKKQYLEKEHASGPHRWSAAEPGKKMFPHDELNLEQEKGADENCRAVRDQCALAF